MRVVAEALADCEQRCGGDGGAEERWALFGHRLVVRYPGRTFDCVALVARVKTLRRRRPHRPQSR